MSRSLIVASKYIETVQDALTRNGYPSQKALAEEIGITRGTRARSSEAVTRGNLA